MRKTAKRETCDLVVKKHRFRHVVEGIPFFDTASPKLELVSESFSDKRFCENQTRMEKREREKKMQKKGCNLC